MTSTHTLTKGLSIRQRILLGFVLLIVLSATIVALNIYHLRNFHSLFKQHQEVSSDTNSMLEVDANIAELQRLILAYATTDRTGDISNILSLHTHIKQQISSLILHQQGSSPTIENLLKELDVQVANLQEKIERLQVQRKERETIVNEKLFNELNKTDEQLHLVYEHILNSSNSAAINQLWTMQHHLAIVQTQSAEYFNTHQHTDKKIIQDTFEDLRADIINLRELNLTDSQINLCNQLLKSIIANEQLFHTAVQADRNYLFLINIVIAGESAEIANVSDELKRQFIALEHQVYQTAEQQSLFNERLTISASIVGALLAMLIAFLIGKKLSDPLISITNTFSKLASGENVATIPGTERTDEIGSLANAANVFRETNKRTQDLLEQTESFATELKQRESALEQAVAKAQDASLAKSQFLANMSHELRTPMNAILGMVALLKKTPLNTRQTDYTLKSEAAARTLLSLLNDILDLSKAEAGKIELDPTPFSLDQLLDDLNVILAPLASAKDIALNLQIDPDLPRNYLGDALRLQQILINLGSNAIKFTHTGSVTIAINACVNNLGKRKLFFSVIDTGIGIAPENVRKIFSGFTQAEASTTRRYGGTGLGLAISRRLVALMGGHLEVDSELDQGSHFHFTLDLPELDAEALQQLQTTPESAPLDAQIPHLQGMKILLVEDNPTNQQIAQELLELEGAEVQTANQGQTALEILRQYTPESVPFDAVLMDIQMPVMDGFSATAAIRSELQLHQLPIIAMTANAMASDRDASLAAGMNDHIGKPFDITQLVNVLCHHTGREPNQTAAQPLAMTAPTGPATCVVDNPIELDIGTAIKRMGGRADLYERMLPKFIQTLDAIPEQLTNHLATQDHDALAKSFHSLKGSASTFGFVTLAEKAAQAESAFKSGISPEQAAQLVADATQIIRLSLLRYEALKPDIQQAI